MRVVLALLVAIFSASQCEANWFSYSEWAALPEDGQALYIAGAYDSLVTYVTNDAAIGMAKHYSQCVENSRMTNSQLAVNVRTYASTQPALQGGTVQRALVGYLIELCGKVPQ
jgi:hypothetical protein